MDSDSKRTTTEALVARPNSKMALICLNHLNPKPSSVTCLQVTQEEAVNTIKLPACCVSRIYKHVLLLKKIPVSILYIFIYHKPAEFVGSLKIGCQPLKIVGYF
jgi:hypothetical protein